MATEKKLNVDETTGEVIETPADVTPAKTVPAKDSDLDFAFNVAQSVDATDAEVEAAASEWKFPGIRVTRSPFTHKGKKMFSYAANMNLKLSNGTVYQLTCELRSTDRKNASNYEKLDAIWAMLPKDQTYMLLGFQYVEYYHSYNLCVQIEDNGIPLRVSLSPRDAKSADDLASMISYLRKRELL